MEVEPNKSNGSTAGIKEKGLQLYPVPPQASGQGLPYAPIDWPCPGDVCGWKVGRRVTVSGYHLDRYLYLPSRFSKKIFSSKLALEQHIRKEFPDTDIDDFFKSFSWKVPFKKTSSTKVHKEDCPREVAVRSRPESQLETGGCKAGNRMCSSLALASRNTHLSAMNCDICCTEPLFCRDCSCVLCCKSVASSYSFIKCEAPVSEGYICGHVAHMDCALRSYLAGTVGGSIGLDAEYHCRRCDMRTDLVSHVARLLKTCESVDSRDDIEKILGVGICILRGSHKASAKNLLNQIELAMTKLRSGTALEDIWKVEVDKALPAGSFHGKDAPEVTNPQATPDGYIISDQGSESQRLEDEIDKVLQALRKSQVSEYKIAEERLYAQKSYLLSLYKQLEESRSQLSRGISSANTEALLDAVVNTSDRIRQEVKKLRDMEKVAKGFGRTPKGILKEHFTLEVED